MAGVAGDQDCARSDLGQLALRRIKEDPVGETMRPSSLAAQCKIRAGYQREMYCRMHTRTSVGFGIPRLAAKLGRWCDKMDMIPMARKAAQNFRCLHRIVFL